MWNVAAVVAALRAAFPVGSGMFVLPWDASLAGPGDMHVMALLYRRADVVVTGAGLPTIHHVLLKEGGSVVDVERFGVAWENVELQHTFDAIINAWGYTGYEEAQVRAGVLPGRGKRAEHLDWSGVRSFSDFRVNLRSVVASVATALDRGRRDSAGGADIAAGPHTGHTEVRTLLGEPYSGVRTIADFSISDTAVEDITHGTKERGKWLGAWRGA